MTKKLIVRKHKTSTPTVAEQVYDGPLPKSSCEYRDDLVLVPVADRPDTEQFPKCNPLGIPPETFYVFDTEKRRCMHMISFDGAGIGTSWDSDRDGRYFLRARRPNGLLCPRYVEYVYDSTAALKAGEMWNHAHPNYRGSLSGKVNEVYQDYQSPRTRADARKKPITVGAPSRAPKKVSDVRPAAHKPRPLKKHVDTAKSGSQSLMNDRAALNKAAEGAAASLASGFSKSKKPIRKRLKNNRKEEN